MIQQLQKLDETCNIGEIMGEEDSKQVAAPARGMDPIFDVKVTLSD